LVGDETYLPYQRPPLSKKFLAGEMPAERLYVKPASFYDDANIDVHLDTRVDAIDRAAKTIATTHGQSLSYDTLVLATGSEPRRLTLDGSELGGIHYLRSIADVEAIRSDLGFAKRIVIIGAGYIGLEVAAVTRKLGLDVTVIEMADRVMSRVVSEQVSAFYQHVHQAHGVRLMLSAGLQKFIGTDRVTAVETSTGEQVNADVVVVGVGILPSTGLAEAAGLEVDNGIVVNERCVTSDPSIYAIGDCTVHPNGIYARPVRLESVHNALEQAKTAATNICGEDLVYDEVPWFWSDQYDLKLQIAGLSEGYDDVVIRGDMAANAFSCLYLRDGRLIAIDAINSPRDFVQSKALIANHTNVLGAPLSDTNIMLKDCRG
ncbi:MAG: FAD-dependent oxidoreductase, partial [Woeseiaceae bacterium]|nr:FAD-dependent oxidoreductase [Woeseiaceae bacterium]